MARFPESCINHSYSDLSKRDAREADGVKWISNKLHISRGKDPPPVLITIGIGHQRLSFCGRNPWRQSTL